jgi:predicted amidohydrolase
MHNNIPTQSRNPVTNNGKIVTVGLIQTTVSDNLEGNMQKIAKKIEEAAEKGAQIVCLQELYRSQYFPQKENVRVVALAETIPGESTKIFSTLAKKHQIVIIAPIFEKNPNGKFYNSAAIIGSDGKILGIYRKVHIPQDPYFYEKEYFAQSEQDYRVYKTAFAKIGVLICYDQWFPEPARINALEGRNHLYPTAIGYVKATRARMVIGATLGKLCRGLMP